MRERRGILRWLVIGGLATLGARCDCSGCLGLGSQTPKQHGERCFVGGCGPHVICEAPLECCVAPTTKGTGESLCMKTTECVPGAPGDPCEHGSDAATCEEPYVCEITTCECPWPLCLVSNRHIPCSVDAGPCLYKCCDSSCDSPYSSCTWPGSDGGADARDSGTDASDGRDDGADADADADAGEAPDAEAADAEPDADVPDAQADDAAPAVDA
jgi:hypothetical protein